MELKDTVQMMQSEDYKERFKAEYLQLNNTPFLMGHSSTSVRWSYF